MIMFVPMNFPSVFALDKYGLRIGVCLGIVLTTVGLWLRCLINKSFWMVIVG
jgi:fucose permease